MTQKTKAIVLIIIILVATIVIGVYTFKQKKAQPASQSQQQDVSSQAADQNMSEEQAQGVTADITKGEVLSITDNSIEIKNGEEKGTLAITEDTAVVLVEGEKIERKTIADIKKGDTISIMTNQIDGTILSIQIGKDAGNVF